jgi:ubiquinone/menaquinone biosynthesis C-methylase UbiE
MTHLVDRWSRWLLHDRFGGDAAALRQAMDFLEPIRNKVLRSAGIISGETVLDVGCGDGLLGFGALPMVGDTGRVVFSDVSQELLERCRHGAGELGVLDRCSFVQSPAETLIDIEDASVDVLVTRSVLIYVEDKRSAFESFRRVLRPGGRIALFEPVNRRMADLNRDTLFGYDTTPIRDVAAKVKQVFEAAAPSDGAMMGFGETALFYMAEEAGFTNVTVSLELFTVDQPPAGVSGWSNLLATRPNPNAPTYGEAIEHALTVDEADQFEAYLRPLVDSGADAKTRMAVAYVAAERPH